jgi:hypothetical protein
MRLHTLARPAARLWLYFMAAALMGPPSGVAAADNPSRDPDAGKSTNLLARGTTVARSAEDRFGDTLNVLDFGADPTGRKDSAAAINATIAAALRGSKEPRSGVRYATRNIFVPCGFYKLMTPIMVWSVEGLTFGGAGACTVFLAGTPMTSPFDLNGVCQSTFQDFSISGDAPADVNTFQYGIYLYWDPKTSARPTTSVRFHNIAVGNGRFVDAFRAGSKPGIGSQVSETEWSNCLAQGLWKPGETTWWQTGFVMGDGRWANNLNHSIVQSEVTGVRYGVFNDSTNVSFRGGMIQHTESDLFAGNIAGYFVADGFRSEGSQRLLVQPWVSGPKQITLSNIEWRLGPDLAPDHYVIHSQGNGNLLLQNVSFEKEHPDLPCPKILHGNQRSSLILDGVSVSYCTPGDVIGRPAMGAVALVRGFLETGDKGGIKVFGDEIYGGDDGLAFGPWHLGEKGGDADTHLFRTSNGVLATDKGLQHSETATKPVCDAQHRGLSWFTQGNAGAKDIFEVCAKDASEGYQWRTLY